jgi:3-hydroxy-3-methylglutaryl CoA synthase
MGFYAPRFYLDLKDFALKRNIDPEKLNKGLLSKEMRLPDVDEDIISIGVKAGYNALMRGNISPKSVDAVLCGTETETYAVKSVSNIFAELLGIPSNSLTQDIYNACAGGTLAILNALALIERGIIKRALVINADISSYLVGSPSEPTQGSGAIAIILSKNPRIASFSKNFGKISGNVNDFWRAPHEKNAQVFGHYSLDTYLNFQLGAYDDLIKNIGDFHADHYVFHAPFAKLPIKCMQQIIQKRWINHITNLMTLNRKQIKLSLIKKVDHFLHDLSILPEFIYLKLKEKGYTSEVLEDISYRLISNVKERVFPQLRVPSHFGNMYNASVWAQILYILENYSRINDIIYFGSYGSGATCISGLLKVEKRFNNVVSKGPKVNDFINKKERKSVQEYELMKTGNIKPEIILGNIVAHEQNEDRGFILRFCDEGCLIPNIKGLNKCPKGHSGYHERFFPLFAVLDSNPIKATNNCDLNYLCNGLVRIANNAKKGNCLEYELRRILPEYEQNLPTLGLLNWSPIYIPVENIY